jgi:coenzyme Q-binding protein COQ10
MLLFRRSPITKRHGECKIIKTHPLHLFRIIQNVDDYQHFLPFCSYSKVDPTTISKDGRTFHATLIVGNPPLFSEEYISKVLVQPEFLTIRTTSIVTKNQLFDSLISTWQLKPVPLLQQHEPPNASIDDDDSTQRTRSILSPPPPPPLQIPLPYSTIGCSVDLTVEMTVSDPFVVTILDQLLFHVAGKQVQAFEERCNVIPYPSIELLDASERIRVQQQNQ